MFPGMRTESGDLIVIAVKRAGVALDHAELQSGDVAPLRGAWDALDRHAAQQGIVAVDEPTLLRRQTIHLGRRSCVSIAVVLIPCTLLTLEVAPAVIIAMTAAGTMVALRVLSVPQAQQSVALSTLVVVAGMIPLSTAIQTSGRGRARSRAVHQQPRHGARRRTDRPVDRRHCGCVSAAVPHGYGRGRRGGVLTPVATPAHLMIMEPGALRFGDYWKLGLPLVLLFGAVATFLVPAIWRY